MPTYSDSEMRAIMGRALQIDSGRSERFTPEQLRTIAGELGISTQALEVAMYEADTGNARVMTPGRSPARWARLAAIAALVVVTAGAIAIAARRGGEDHASVVERRAVRATRVDAPEPVIVERVPEPTKTTTKTATRATTKTRF